MTHPLVRLTMTALFCLCLIGQQPARAADNLLQQNLQQVLENSPATTLGFIDLQTLPDEVNRMLLATYQENENQPYWVTEQGPGQKAEALVSVLQSSEEDGLDPEQYRLKNIEKLWKSAAPHDLAALDVMLTLALGNYVADMREGQAVTCLLDPKLFAAARDKKVNISEVIKQALAAPDIIRFLQNQAPQHHGYQSLKKVLARYKDLKKQGGWPAIPAGKVLKPGMHDQRLPLIVKLHYI